MLSLKKCRERLLVPCNARLLATGTGGGGGDSKGGGRKGGIDFDALFKSVSRPQEKKEGAGEPIDFKKLFGNTVADKSQFKLDLTPPKREGGTIDSEKLKIDLSKLFADSPGTRTTPGDGGLKGFKLDLSKIKSKAPQLPPKEGTTSAAQDVALKKMGILNKFADVTGPSLKPVPPKDHLLEKYLAPENMSAAEFQKIELQKVRSEFKLHDADCGSSGVQIAALTKKMSFLSKHLMTHKKDVPSRRSMNTMVQRRRKLMIYLRRTDWPMYCYVISRLLLKDRIQVSNRAMQAGTKKKTMKDKRRRKKRKVKKSEKYRKKANDV
ncbi:hypothetical protein SELMODRAFT_446623 [Selaginella moellendorffii]|uniref:Small ribosomal subunit protein uS15c n=1 Tax=Selaginella moellendorffii TaxID=88036 RepID=D8ST27_SELML|nr:uncharacterized protein LOC9659317 [Selaginella moellendorffii]XP_024516242.1 uncharacterized protein LOC9659317 [Selaginella moellendorffii]EFJ12330.1 hypothetical protein SELMODRAFT_446623 [Selaginella moellendorffii]|eukprot:XP_002986473.1 uncharacterized protein LOC9659317 [Selaginella moellendorffii]